VPTLALPKIAIGHAAVETRATPNPSKWAGAPTATRTAPSEAVSES
jgi:hypothetical protein